MNEFERLLLITLVFIVVLGTSVSASGPGALPGEALFSRERFQARKEAEHPFLIFNEDFIPILKERIKREPYRTWWNAAIFTDAVHTQGLAWILTGKGTHAEAAKTRLLNYNWPGLNSSSHSHMMEPNSHTVKIMCQGYDMIYNYPGLTDKDKELIEDKFADIAEDLYRNVLIQAGGQNPGNQRTLGASVLGTIALTIPNYTKEGYHTPEEWLERALEAIFREDNLGYWYDDGFFVEGVGYSIYMGLNFLPFIYQYKEATGINLFEHPVIRNWLINWGYQEMSNGLHVNIGSTIMDYPASFHREILVNEALGEDAHFFRFLYDRKKGAYDSKKIGAPSFERKGNLLSDIRRYLADNKRYRSEISALKTVSYPAIHRNTLVDILCYYDHGIEPMVSDEYSPTRIFPKSQHACLGSGWDKDSVTMWITGKDWLLPSNYARPYSHEDVGNFIITAYGELLIVDAGYDHWASRYFNLAPHHNVILVEGDGQISGPTPTTTGILEDFIATDFLDSVDVSSFYADTSFLRRVLFPGKEYFVIWDKVESSSERSYHWLFHSPIRQGKGQILADNNRVSWPGWDIYNDVPGNARLDIFFASPLKMEPYRESQWIPVASWDYKGTFRESIKASKAGTSTTLLTALYPYPTGGATPSFKRVEVERGEGIVVHTLKGDIDIILSQGGDGTLKAQGLKTDAAVLFLRKTDSGNGFQFFSMYDGKTLELNGKEIIKSQEGITVALRVQHQGALEGWMIPKADGHGFRIKFYVFGRRPECVLLDGRQIPFEYETGSDYIEINMEPGYGPCDIKVLLESL